jgi:hypothetical protein
MGKTKGPMNPEFPEGTVVRIADRAYLEDFLKSWKYHNKLQPDQLNFAGQEAQVEKVGFYHGGDELYRLRGIPGIWHEECLEPILP